MRVYLTQKRRPKERDANQDGQVLATNTGRHGFRAVKVEEVTPELFKEWAPLDGPVTGTEWDQGPRR